VPWAEPCPPAPRAVRSRHALGEERSMCRAAPLLAVLSLAFAPAPPSRPDPSKDDLKAMQGEWRITRYVSDGWSRPEKDFFPVKMSGTRLSGVCNPPVEIALNARARPKRIDLKVSRTLTIEGIYRLEGDEVTICWCPYRLDPVPHYPPRPKDFNVNPGITLTCRLKR
jgi:uncharacterized protein (TIGR03067 family)